MVNFGSLTKLIKIVQMKTYPLILALIFMKSTFLFSQSEARLMRFPAMNAKSIAFCYAGQLYTVARDGGVARQLTSGEGYVTFPHFSPDGKWIAFTGQFDGNTEVYLIPAEGGTPKRLTYTATLNRDDISDRMGPNNIVMGWTPDGKKIIYRSRKQTFNDFVGSLFTVSINGGLSEELPLSSGGFCSFNADGSKLAFNRVFREFRTWKYYKGGMADDIRIFDFKSGKTEKITDNVSQDIFPMWIGDEIYFASDRDRTMNIFKYNLTSKTTEKVSDFKEYDVKFPTFSGTDIIFENGGYIYILDTKTKQSRKIEIKISNDLPFGRSFLADAARNIQGVSLSPGGERLALVGRGDVFSVPVKSGITRNLTASSGAHDRSAVWSPDGKYIAYLSDRSGEFEIWIQKQDGTEAALQLTKNADTYYFGIAWSPDSKKILFSDKKLRLQMIDVETRKVTLVSQSKVWEYNDFAWSPDSRFIAFSEPMKTGMNKIRIYSLETGKTNDVTDEWYASGNPVFSRDGKYLFFVSERDFNPIYSETEWNHAYADMSKVYFVTLEASAQNPLAPKNDEVKIEQKNSEEPKKEENTAITVKIDFDNINNRIVALPIGASNYWGLESAADQVFYLKNGMGMDNTQLMCFDLSDRKENKVGDFDGFELSANAKKIMVRKGKSYYVADITKADLKVESPVSLSDCKMTVDRRAEWNQIYYEAWRQMRDFFYVENMHGLNWEAMKKKYEVLLPYVNNRNDLNYIIGELIGELNIGHAYVGGGDVPEVNRISMGLLGAKVSKDKSGYFRIDKILSGANWNSALRSPLTEIGVDVKEGEYIIAVNNINLKNVADIYQTLVDKANKQVEIKVNSRPEEAGARTVVIVPVADESALYYYNWVQGNIRLVNEKTNGEVGYIHIPDMGVEGLVEFSKYFYPQLNKKALIIDDRGNGGGNVSPMILERLMRTPTRANMARNVQVAGTTPTKLMNGPKVLLLNQYSASDGDLFPYGFKKHNVGRTIGVRSWGGVVGIRGSLPFVDGAYLNKPEFASYSIDESKWIIEGYGVDPDIVIDNDPAEEYKGVDTQLLKAIEVVLDEMKNSKPVPEIPQAPDKTK